MYNKGQKKKVPEFVIECMGPVLFDCRASDNIGNLYVLLMVDSNWIGYYKSIRMCLVKT